MYELREKKNLPVVLPSMAEAENFSATHINMKLMPNIKLLFV
jgi:hypothetical protein